MNCLICYEPLHIPGSFHNKIFLLPFHGESTLFYRDQARAYADRCYQVGGKNLTNFALYQDFVGKPEHGSVHLIGEGGAIHAAPMPGEGRLLFIVSEVSSEKINQLARVAKIKKLEYSCNYEQINSACDELNTFIADSLPLLANECAGEHKALVSDTTCATLDRFLH